MYGKQIKRQPTIPGKAGHSFAQVPRADIPRSTFDLSHGVKTTFDADLLIPMARPWDVIPGDSWNVKSTIVARLATPLHPLMDNLYIDTFYFFVAYRTIWTNFEKFMGAQDDPGDTISFTIPNVTTGTVALGSLSDYFGIPLKVFSPSITPSALPFRAYNKIFNEWFRSENLTDSAVLDVDNGPDTLANYVPRKRTKRHDYFTSALPWPQKGATPVSLPLGTSAPIYTLATDGQSVGINDAIEAAGVFHAMDTDGTAGGHVMIDDPSVADAGLFANLTNATAATINELRLAFQTQRLLERDARSGTRYVETLKAHWGVTFPDYTAQRAIYLGGGSIPVGIHSVPATGTTKADENPSGNNQYIGELAGYGTASGQSGFTKSFVEHGVIISLMNCRGDITYSQGLDRYWDKSTRYDFYYPVLSGIGEQSILNIEIWANAAGTDNSSIFGYTGRYNEYRFQSSMLTSLMRPDAVGTLASWNLSEDFSALPTLGNTFIESNTAVPLDRAIAVTTEPHIIADIYHDIKAARPLPLYGVPGGIDHF